MKTKNEDILDKYRRSIAENDNMRKRLTKQIEDAKIYGIQGNLVMKLVILYGLYCQILSCLSNNAKPTNFYCRLL